jgi:bidirectional [NiFe] hydrogenase diaphorase subunit
MSAVTLTIDGKTVQAEAGTTVVAAARGAGIDIPTLCHHEQLKPYTACRICLVEVDSKGWTSLDTACSRPVAEHLVVRTRSERVDRLRRTILELMLAQAPDSPPLQELAQVYGADRDRFQKEASFCIHCGLCVRYCAEVKQQNAVGFFDRGIVREVRFDPRVAAKVCNDCKECFPLCPTSYLQAAFVLVEALSFPPATSKPGSRT